MAPSDIVDRFRRPEYTGENRCLPCSVVNVVATAAVAAVVGVLGRPWYGVAAFAAGVLVVYVRGYLVPGTPAFTRRYFPPWLLRAFGKEPLVDSTAGGGPSTGEVVEMDGREVTDEADETEGRHEVEKSEVIDEADATEATEVTEAAHEANETGGVVTFDEATEPALTSGFREAWAKRTRRVRERGVGTDDVRALFDAESVSRVGDDAFVVDGSASVRWASVAALVADVAAGPLLDERCDDWTTFDRGRRQSVLAGLRLCLDRCPACDGTLTVTEREVDPCCQRPHRVAESVCDDCGAVVADAAVVATDGRGPVAARHLAPLRNGG